MRLRTPLLALLLSLASADPALAKLDAAEWAKAEKSAKTLFVEAGETDAKAELVKTLVSDGEARAYRLLADALLLEGGHVPRVAKAYEEAIDKLQPMLARSFREMKQTDYDALVLLQANVRNLQRDTADEIRVMDQIVDALAAGPADVRKSVLAKVKTHGEWTMRAAGARLAAATPDDAATKPYLLELLEKDKDARVRRAALETLGRAKGRLWHPLLVGRVGDPDWTVQILAARIAAESEVGRAIPALIEALGKADPRVAEEIGAALRKLTNENFGADVEPWTKWWADNRGKFGDDGRPLEPLGPAAPNPRDVEFYGLKVKTDRVLFVVDMSSSMKEPVDPVPPTTPPGAEPTTGPPPPPPEPAGAKTERIKIDVARRELKRGLDSLPKTASFNVIAFNHTVSSWQPNMSPATPENRSKAYEWFAAMEPGGSTYIDGALQMAFKMAGTGSFDKSYGGAAIDTILLLTDGAPTDNGHPSSNNMDPAEVLRHVDEWNARRLVRIHCVGIDRIHGIDFLKKLAAANGGTYVDG